MGFRVYRGMGFSKLVFGTSTGMTASSQRRPKFRVSRALGSLCQGF